MESNNFARQASGTGAVFGPATVTEVDQQAQRLRVHLEKGGDAEHCWARMAVFNGARPRWGDRVLVAGDSDQSLYVVAVLEYHNTSPAVTALEGGAQAEVSSDAVRIFDHRGSLLVEFDAEKGKTRIHAQTSDLEFVSSGAICFNAGAGMRLESAHGVDVHGHQGVTLQSGESAAGASAVELNPHRLRMSSPEWVLGTGKARVACATAGLQAEELLLRTRRAKLVAQTLERVADKVIDRAKNLYQNVEGLSQLVTGRLRTLARDSVHMKGRRLYVRGEKDVKLQGDKINIG